MAALYTLARGHTITRKRPRLFAGNFLSRAWPPAGFADLTVVFGTPSIFAGPTPPAGTLRIDNTNGTDSAYAFFNSMPAAIRTSVQATVCPIQTGATGVNGLYARATLQGAPPILFNGYRFDFFTPFIRLIRFDAGAVGAIQQLDLTGFDGGYYTNANNLMQYNLVDNGAGNLMQGFLSAPGRLTTGTVGFTAPNSTPYPTGRIGFMMFQNLPGSGPAFFSSYAATWTV